MKSIQNKARERSKQLDLWEVVTLASHFEKMMGNSRPQNVRRTVDYGKELDAAEDRIDAVIETVILSISILVISGLEIKLISAEDFILGEFPKFTVRPVVLRLTFVE